MNAPRQRAARARQHSESNRNAFALGKRPPCRKSVGNVAFRLTPACDKTHPAGITSAPADTEKDNKGGKKLTYRLYGVPDFANLAVHLALEETAAPYEAVFLGSDAGDLKTPDHLARHPLGMVPALETPDGTMIETAAILLWLADRHGSLAPTPNHPDRAAFLSAFFFTSSNIHIAALDLLHPYRPAGDGPARDVASGAHDRLMSRLAVLDRIAAGNPAWWPSDRPTILTIYLALLTRWTRAFPAYPDLAINLSDFPALHARTAALETRPTAQRVAALHGLTGRFLTEPEG
ncbi:MAG: glutathione S-transferase [Rhodobacteraceae bacterium PARR1]|nr:MAG: glutathione S-transferase [Rhodobacteraceae bacterium PARR1]